MFSFIDYLWEIFIVGKVKEVDVGVAYSMFKADVSAGEALKYNTGDALSDFDFASAKENWDKLTEDEQKSAISEWHKCIDTYYVDLCAMFAMLSGENI